MKNPSAHCENKLDKKLKKDVDTKTAIGYGIAMIKNGTSQNKETAMRIKQTDYTKYKVISMGMDFGKFMLEIDARQVAARVNGTVYRWQMKENGSGFCWKAMPN